MALEHLPHPRQSTEVIGHDASLKHMLELVDKDRLPNAWLISGAKGIGKATLAYQFVKEWFAKAKGETGDLLGANLDVDPKIALGSHPDILTIERSWDDKTKRLAKEIKVDTIRDVQHFLHLTSSEVPFRLVIIDGAEYMNMNAANALLKLLEEPPKGAHFILITHSHHAVLPTIRSRCHHMALKPLSKDQAQQVINHVHPMISMPDRDMALTLMHDSPGEALLCLNNDVLMLYQKLLNLLQDYPNYSVDTYHGLVNDIAKASNENMWENSMLCMQRIVHLISQIQVGKQHMAWISDDEERILTSIAKKSEVEKLLNLWKKALSLYKDERKINLDKRLVVMDVLEGLKA